MVKLAIWTSQYPEPYETFIQGETQHLLSAFPGSRVHVLKPGAGSAGDSVQWHPWWHPAAFFFFLIAWIMKPGPMAGILRDLLSGFRGCPRPWEFFKSLAVWPLACRAYHIFVSDSRGDLLKLVQPVGADPWVGPLLQLAHWTNVPSTVAWMIHRLGGPPYVMVVHGENLSSTWPLLKLKLDEAADALSCTQFNANRLAAAGLRKPIVCPHGVEIPPTAADSLPLLGGGQGGGLERGGLKGLSVGRLVPTKGFHILLEALSKLEGNWRWTIVGDGPEEVALKSQSTRLGIADRVTFTGRLPHAQVLALYPQHQVFALPFIRDGRGDGDGLPNALLEAMAAGLAVIASNDAAAPEAVEDGVNGILVSPGDPMALNKAIERLSRDTEIRSRMGSLAIITIRKSYEKSACMQKLKESIEESFRFYELRRKLIPYAQAKGILTDEDVFREIS